MDLSTEDHPPVLEAVDTRLADDTAVPGHTPPALPTLAALNAAAIAIAGLYFGSVLFIPLVLAVLLAFVLAPPVALLQRAGLGKAAPVMIAVALAFVVISGIGAVVGGQVTALAESLPSYSATFHQKITSLPVGREQAEELEQRVRSMLGSGPGPAGPEERHGGVAAPGGGMDASSAFSIVRAVAAPVLAPLATLGLVVVFAIFILLAREDLRDRVVRLVGRRDLHRTILAMNDAAGRLSRYFLTQLALNTAFGAFIAAGLWVVGLPNVLLWGILAGLMRFVPFVGTFIAVVPPLLLALAAVHGWSAAAMVLGLFVVSEMVTGQVIEPLVYGQSTGLSPFAIILATAFWSFLWGPVGLLIATPLTVCLVVVGRHVEALSFLDVILGDRPPLEPAEMFYLRAIENNAKELAVQARERISEGTAAEYFDHIALPGLALAQADVARDALSYERLDVIHGHIDRLLEKLAAAQAPAKPAPAWSEDGSVICIPCRGQLDDLAATMAVQVLRAEGFGAQCQPNTVLGAIRTSADGAVTFPAARLCCLSVLEEGSSATAVRYLLRRIERQMPGALIAICLWHAASDSAMLADLRSDGKEELIVLSIGELVALTRAVSARGN